MEVEPKHGRGSPCGQLLSVGSHLQSKPTSGMRFKSIRVKKSSSTVTHGVSTFHTIDIISTCFSEASTFIVIEGKPGSGKSMLVKNMLSELLLLFAQIVWIALDSCEGKLVKTIDDLANAVDMPVSQLQNDLENGGENVLFILDGFDDFVNIAQWEATIVSHILSRDMFSHCAILLLSRSSGLHHLWDNTKVSFHFKLEGIIEDDPFTTKCEDISMLCSQYPDINDLCQIPLIAQLVLEFFEHRRKQDNVTLTDICMHIVISVIDRELRRKAYPFTGQIDLFSLPSEELHESFLNLSKFAFHALVNEENLQTVKEEEFFLSSFGLSSLFFLNGSETFGLVERCGGISAFSKQHTFQFIHPLIQEFLAGFYLQHQPPLDLLNLIYHYGLRLLCQNHFYWLLSFFGIAWRKQVDFNPMKLMFTTLLEFLICVLEIEKNPQYSLVTLLLCINETKDTDIWKKLVSKLGGNLRLQLSSEDISQHKWLVATMVSYSNVFEWNIHACDLSIAAELEPYIGARLNHFQNPSMDRSVIELSPKISIDAAAKQQRGVEVFAHFPDKETALLNQYQCRAIREILQRALAMFAGKVKLKGDASNPAYVSFLSCHCFQEKLESNLKFDPNIPFHFLVVTSKKTLKKLQEEHGVHLTAAHDGKAIELVILLKPCVRRVTFKFRSSEYYIMLMSEELAQTEVGKGAIACMVADLDVMNEDLHMCTEEVISGPMSEMVRPPLPLPPQSEQNIRASTVLPPIVVAETTLHIPMMQHELPEHGQLQQPLQRSESHADNEEEGDNGSPGFGSLHFNRCQPMTSEHRPHTITTTTTSVQNRSSIQPGAILFSSAPGQFSTDLIYPLPDETHQLRRGGNGQIYSGTIGSMDVVYKKTNYRSKEFSIITKVKHKNIVPLLAFMYGEENPAHKRRHFCYHIMPRLSGDCARMLTDKKELTIKELHGKHGNNARKMGIIRGNLKYLLKQILQGLRYLHSLCIAHRDIKGSNILLRFHCACTNPLECGCDTKYQVHICDFDAAVELDKSEKIPCTLITSKTSQSTHIQYTCVPVGTNGFRSPECSMLTVSNSSETFSPPINTRCDIWSLGILTTRMLVGATGPSTQRQMALLLLFYHRQRYIPEGLHEGGYLVVDKLVTDKLLNLPELIKEVGWLKGAVRFVECCVAVDPLTRHSAEALLQHDFLY